MRFPLTRPERRFPREHGVRGHRLRRILIAALLCVSVLPAVWVIACYFLFVDPAVDQPARSDAVVVLAPAVTTGRLDYAIRLMSEGHSTILVISMPDGESGNPSSDVCGERGPYRIICFSPEPTTTQGEARAIQRLSEENDWRTITVVTDDSHVTRARTIIKRCYSHDLDMAAVRPDLPLEDWVYRFAYETAAFVKVAADPGC